MRIDQAAAIFQKLGRQFIPKGDRYWLGQCLNPKHQDNKPSMRISASHPHFFKCYSCGYTGTLNSFALDMGIEVDREIALPQHLHKSPKLPNLGDLVLQEWDGDYRGLTAEHWRYFGAKKWYDYMWDSNINNWFLAAERLWLPIYMNGALLSYVGRRIDDSELFRYKNYEGAFFSELLYPYDMIAPGSPIVLVEGPLDAIKFNLYQIPTLCFFGVQNWSSYKLRLLLQKAPSTIWICMDGDERGQEGQFTLKNKLKAYGDVQDIQLPQGVDPFDLIPELTLQLKDQIWDRHHKKIGTKIDVLV